MPSVLNILLFSDSHFGCGTEGYQQQPRRPDLIDVVFKGLKDIVQQHQVHLALHSGDITENGTRPEINIAKDFLFGLNIPIACCLGNHDLTTKHSFAMWRKFSQDNACPIADHIFSAGDWDYFLLNNTWTSLPGKEGWHWGGTAEDAPGLFDSQLVWLDEGLRKSPLRPAILLLHVGTHIPGNPTYADALNRLLDRHPRVKLVLSGHTHAIRADRRGGRVHLSISSLIEPPFECCLIKCCSNSVTLEVLPTIPMPDDVKFLEENAWISGRPEDRNIQLAW